MFPSYYNSVVEFLDNPLNHTLPLDGKVYVISDSAYKKHKQHQAEEEIRILERRAESYEKTAASIHKTILELKQEAGLLEPAEEPDAS